ncbi:MAG: hypothetical protein Kow0037_11360 [Calditrichia bacterium]
MNRKFNLFEDLIVGESPIMQSIIETAKKIAGSQTSTVLIVGESGTGKEILARYIHKLSHYSQQPFVDINCGAIPENLLESELFGHEKGAFTGAYKAKPGLFELAHGGTIFLDEINSTSFNFQVKLLKIVENKTFRRIGGLEEKKVSTRIIAASNSDLERLVREGTFREDLFYRLNVYQIKIPPLRKRGEDIILLAEKFIEHYNKEYQRKVKGLAPSAKRLIMGYPWPGNVRQLKNAIERAVLVESDEWIEAEDLNLSLSNAPYLIPKEALEKNDIIHYVETAEFPPGGVSLEEVERALIQNALKKSNGNLSKAARLLQINRGKLRYRLEKLGITQMDILKLRGENH